ncbi:TonB-dependent receptor [Robiginitalea sediminis]|uniref:hypothetical protein n=1 Tax=Robiginitalea sediminis TaxID=1982593 RepID=UPI00117BB089|nr:hypothetical protein [Robiginitalea sediminis]
MPYTTAPFHLQFLPICLLAVFLSGFNRLQGQQCQVSGRAMDAQHRSPLAGVLIYAVGSPDSVRSRQDGHFVLAVGRKVQEIRMEADGYASRRFPIDFHAGDSLALGEVGMRPRTAEPERDFIVIGEASETEGESRDQASGLLTASRDHFLSRAAFDFSAGFFRPRGLASSETQVYFNGIPVNSDLDRRPMWRLWSGLTDIARRPETYVGRAFSAHGFGSPGGTVAIEAMPSSLRPGSRATLSASSRSYAMRQMWTHNSGPNPKGLGYLVSLSHRWGNTGYVQGTPYRSVAGYGVLEWKISRGLSAWLSAVVSRTRRGRSAALTQEAAKLLGHRYNPYWGKDEGRVRNAREQWDMEPFITAGIRKQGERFQWRLSSGYHWGRRTSTRLAYFNAPNPDPVAYRNMPSYYYNAPIGPNFENVARAAASLRRNPQIDWGALRRANMAAPGGEARYVLSGDEQQSGRWVLRASGRYRWNSGWHLDAAAQAHGTQVHHGARVLDLLGAQSISDTDPFTGTRNDMEGSGGKGPGDIWGYSYSLLSKGWEVFAQAGLAAGPWDAGLALRYGHRRFMRMGHFRNARYPDESLGESPWDLYSEAGIKGFLGYRYSGRLWVRAYFGMETRAPGLQEVFTDPREHSRIFPDPNPPSASGGSLTLYGRYPRTTVRISAYYNRFSGGRSLRSYFTETAYGAAFIREIAGQIGQRHLGLEGGIVYQASPVVNLNLAGAFGVMQYWGNPRLWLQAYPGGDRAQGFPPDGLLDAGRAALGGSPYPSGPQCSIAVGAGYRDPTYWWLDLRAIYLGGQYASPAFLRHTQGFEGLQEAPEINPADDGPHSLGASRKPLALPGYYLLNLSLGKSWLIGKHYISGFLGLNNLFNNRYRTGGYQQGRLATYQEYRTDLRSGHPSFGPRYWRGYGRTFYLNIAWSF